MFYWVKLGFRGTTGDHEVELGVTLRDMLNSGFTEAFLNEIAISSRFISIIPNLINLNGWSFILFNGFLADDRLWLKAPASLSPEFQGPYFYTCWSKLSFWRMKFICSHTANLQISGTVCQSWGLTCQSEGDLSLPDLVHSKVGNTSTIYHISYLLTAYLNTKAHAGSAVKAEVANCNFQCCTCSDIRMEHLSTWDPLLL